uniref:Odorant receptor n=1 Tax=Lampronia capitella TaxID=485574 RepID=A0A2Z4EY58_9NEOP|nr:odorant receptor 8 [Lampronia capitella]
MTSDAVVQLQRRDPLKTKQWKWIRLYLTALGMWPKVHFGEPRSRLNEWYHMFLIVHTLIVMYSQIHYLVSHYATTSFFEMGHMLVTLFLNVHSHVRLQLAFDKAFGPMLKHFFTKMHLFNYEYHNTYSIQIMEKIERFSWYLALYYIVLLNIGCPIFSMIAWGTNYLNGAYSRNNNVTLVSAVYLATPFDTEHNLFNWILLAAYDLYFTYLIAGASLMNDLTLYLITFQIMGHILILENNLKTIPKPPSRVLSEVTYSGSVNEIELEMFTEEENVEIHAKLKRFITEQRHLEEFINEIANRYDLVLLVTYLYHLVNGCIVLLELLRGGKAGLVQYGFLATGIFVQLISISVILEQVCTLSDRLGDAVYSTPWQCMSVRNQKTVLLFLMRVQTPMMFKAMGVAEVGVKPMAGILKTTLSYFAFLNSLE